MAVCSQRIFPSLSDRHTNFHDTGSLGLAARPMVLGSITPPLIPLGLPPLPATAVDTNTYSPTTSGCDHPLPSIGVRQAACGGWVQSLGSCDCALTLNALPPRNCRQSSALLAAGLPTLVTNTIINPIADAFGSQSFDALVRICFMFILLVPGLKTDWVKTVWAEDLAEDLTTAVYQIGKFSMNPKLLAENPSRLWQPAIPARIPENVS